MDPLDFQLSDSDAQHFVSCLLNVVGAADGLFKAAASGSDLTLFFKVYAIEGIHPLTSPADFFPLHLGFRSFQFCTLSLFLEECFQERWLLISVLIPYFSVCLTPISKLSFCRFVEFVYYSTNCHKVITRKWGMPHNILQERKEQVT